MGGEVVCRFPFDAADVRGSGDGRAVAREVAGGVRGGGLGDVSGRG